MPWTDQYRAVMPATVRTNDDKIIFVASRMDDTGFRFDPGHLRL